MRFEVELTAVRHAPTDSRHQPMGGPVNAYGTGNETIHSLNET